ncbi:MAG: LPS-assembly protein LptD [Melioribacteraceae bacterium]|nr:LPS-assembly protein LptD [Melioribacteraceae bacterium]
MKKNFYLFFLFPIFLSAQQSDTLFSKNEKNISSDSIQVADTIKSKKSDIDAIVFASASDSLIFNVKNKMMYVHGKGELKYKTTELKSGKIVVDYNTNELEALGFEVNPGTDSVRVEQTPLLVEGNDNYEGSRILYNFKNQRGFISLAKNKKDEQRYEGAKVKKVDKNTFFIDDGIFTTCENDTPHTYFSADKMKIIQKDKIIARWIFMHIGGVPVPIPLPFAVFPNETGRRSGIIIPGYGQSALRGQYFTNFGYFFALSDYFDLALTGDYYTKGGWGARNRVRYAKRYSFSGQLNAGYSKILIGEPNDTERREQTDWNVSWYHNQQIDPSSRLDANLQFVSSNFYSNNSINFNDLLSQDIISNASYSKYWEQSGTSLSLNYSRTQKLQTGDIYESLPNISFSKSITYPFKRDDVESLSDQKWYEYINYSYNGQFTNQRNKEKGQLKIRGGFQHNLSVSASPKVGYFSVSPSINYNEKWYNKRTKLENQTFTKVNRETGQITSYDSTVAKTINELNFVRTFDLSISASTKLYGVMQPNLFGVEAFRHTLIPSISYNYNPNFSDEVWGYYETFKDAEWKEIRYDKYSGEIFGGVNDYESQNISLSVGNDFEMKMAKAAGDTTREQTKVRLLNFSLSTSYNFAKDSVKLSDLSLSYRTQIGDWVNFSGSSSYTFYHVENGKRFNRYLVSEGRGLFRLTNFGFSISTTLSGDKLKSENEKETKVNESNDVISFERKNFNSIYDEKKSADFSIPWNLSLSYNYNISKYDPSVVNKYSNVSTDLSFSLTKNWKFTVRAGYDFDRKEVTAPQITIFRDLHCWEMNFTWNPSGFYRGYRFEIRMKAPELQDIKVTKSGGLFSGRR